MNSVELLESAVRHGECLERGEVAAVAADGIAAEVRFESDGPQTWTCDVLQSGDRALELTPGDQVLVWHPSRPDGRGVVLGRVGRGQAAAADSDLLSDAGRTDIPEELILEAKHSLTLRVGAGSITIHEDGKILIKGKDLVSHAQRMNRIKGGAVAIN